MKRGTRMILRGVMIVDSPGWQESRRTRRLGRPSWEKLEEAHKQIRWRWMAWKMKNLICLSLIKLTPNKVLIRRCGMMWM
jgi:hypothetical protein